MKEVVVDTTYRCVTTSYHHLQRHPDPWEGTPIGGPQLQVGCISGKTLLLNPVSCLARYSCLISGTGI